jgi:hypothetical protein
VIVTSLAQERRTFTIEFSTDQAMSFEDSNGARIRFRYEPKYMANVGQQVPNIGLLGTERLKTPDIALEVYAPGTTLNGAPELIIVLDAKYSSSSQRRKLSEVEEKYSKIGNKATGLVLSRQVWALTPQAPAAPSATGSLESHCTVDNQAFWSNYFEMINPVNGAIQTRPTRVGEFDPLEELLSLLLKRSGIHVQERLAD